MANLAGSLLLVPAAGYHLVQKTWEKLFAWRVLKAGQAPIPVISVGNILMGGSGKTPFVVLLARMLREMGFKPAVVSRGYGGANRDAYLVVTDGLSDRLLAGPDLAGDEPCLIAEQLGNIPVLVGALRIFPVTAAHALFGCDVAVLDDGFQHLRLKRDLDIVLLTGAEDRMFPAGRLREPFSALKRADVIVLTGQGSVKAGERRQHLRNVPVFLSRTVPIGVITGGNVPRKEPPSFFAGTDVALVSGIAEPQRFRATAEGLGWRVADHRCYPDHHVMTEGTLQKLLSTYPGMPLVFTEKDWIKLPGRFKGSSDRVACLRISSIMDDEEAFRNIVIDRLRASAGNPRNKVQDTISSEATWT